VPVSAEQSWQRQGSLFFSDCPDFYGKEEAKVDSADKAEADLDNKEDDSEMPARAGQNWKRQGSIFFADCPEFYAKEEAAVDSGGKEEAEVDAEMPAGVGQNWQRQGSLFFADCPDFYSDLGPTQNNAGGFRDLSDDEWEDVVSQDGSLTESRISARPLSSRTFSEVNVEEDLADLL
jgi:hypothetical protein